MKKNDIVVKKNPDEWLEEKKLYRVIGCESKEGEELRITVKDNKGQVVYADANHYRLATDEEKLEDRIRTMFLEDRIKKMFE